MAIYLCALLIVH